MGSSSTASTLKYYYVAVGQPEDKLTTLVELLHALLVDQQVPLAIACSSRAVLDSLVYKLRQCQGFHLVVLHADLAVEDMEWQVQQLKQQAAGEPGDVLLDPTTAAAAGHPAAAAGHGDLEVGAASVEGEAAAAAAAGSAESAADASEVLPQLTPEEAALREVRSHMNRNTKAQMKKPGGPRPPNMILLATDVCLRALPKSVLPVGVPLLIQYDMPTSKDIYSKRLGTVFGASKERRRGRGVVIDFVVAGEVAAFRARERFTSGPILEMPVHVPDILQ